MDTNQNEKLPFYRRHPVFIALVISSIIGMGYKLVTSRDVEDFLQFPIAGPLWALIYVFPIMLMLGEMYCLILEGRGMKAIGARVFDATALILGIFYEYAYIAFWKNATGTDWQYQLHNAERHTPIYSQTATTVAVIFILAITGYLVLQYSSLETLPPLVTVLSMSAMYLGIIELIILTIQVFGVGNDYEKEEDFYLLILPACCILMTLRTILQKIHEWQKTTMEMSGINENPVLNASANILENVAVWPIFALFLMIPLLGIIIMLLMLVGQAPDSIVKAWTETSEWNLSTKVSPQNIYYDEHYLCTVAAGGHRRIVKPIRKGIRHGHEVTVNRQLCIANAFEQILEEKTPHLHRAVRSFYDKYGFPVARMINSRWTADVVYIMMKPLEWFFLVVIYMVDVHPENRIAVQYMGQVPEYRH